MGIHDREYYQEESSSYSAISEWSMVTKLVIVTSVVYLADLLFGNSHWLMDTLQVSGRTATTPYLWWQFLTYGFAHDPSNITHIFWNMFGLFIFGRQVEAIYGPKEILRFYLVAILLGGIVWGVRAAVMGVPGGMLGASGAVTAVILMFCIHYPKQTILLMMVIPVPAWVVGVMIIAGNILGMRMSDENVAFDVHLVGAAFAIAYYRFGWNLGRLSPNFSIPSSPGKLFKRRPKLRVHRPSSGDDFEQLEAQADDLLEKVNRDGVDSLTAKERDILERYSRSVRNKRR